MSIKILPIYDLRNIIEDWSISVANAISASDNTDDLSLYALHLSRLLAYPNLQVHHALEIIDAMGKELQISLKKRMPLRPTQIIEEINNYLFRILGFRGNEHDYFNPLNNFLNVVIERRLGIPITLSILYMRTAYLLNFKLYPVSFPAHFLVKHTLEDDDSEIIIDPYNEGRIMDDYTLKQLLDQFYPNQNIPLTKDFVRKATATQVLVRLLNNLKASYYESQDLDSTEIANEMILTLDKYNPNAVRDKGILLIKKQRPEQALEMLNLYLELDPEAEDVDVILDTIHKTRSSINKS
ncbi:MAG: transglutaminase-like domain-containing protein [Nitrososphaeraceae archaeon]